MKINFSLQDLNVLTNYILHPLNTTRYTKESWWVRKVFSLFSFKYIFCCQHVVQNKERYKNLLFFSLKNLGFDGPLTQNILASNLFSIQFYDFVYQTNHNIKSQLDINAIVLYRCRFKCKITSNLEDILLPKNLLVKYLIDFYIVISLVWRKIEFLKSYEISFSVSHCIMISSRFSSLIWKCQEN